MIFILCIHHGNRLLGTTKYLIGLPKQDIQRRSRGDGGAVIAKCDLVGRTPEGGDGRTSCEGIIIWIS